MTSRQRCLSATKARGNLLRVGGPTPEWSRRDVATLLCTPRNAFLALEACFF
jgi:hypothetical protein